MLPRRDNVEMRRLVQPLTRSVGESVVEVQSGGKQVALGAIVDPAGYVITKWSELSGDPIRVRLADGSLLKSRVASVRRKSDLALLAIEQPPKSLIPIEFIDSVPAIGSFLITAGRGESTKGLGVVSVASRPIEHQGRLGVMLGDGQGGATVLDVMPSSGAKSAGVVLGDRIIAINGQNEVSRSGVMRTLRGFFPGETVHLTIVRDGTTIELEAPIRDYGMMQESENDSRVNGPRSARLSGFEQVIQHDTVLDPQDCGGPVLSTSGDVIGLNIARAGRVVSYVLPSALVQKEIDEMLTEIEGSVLAED